MSRLFSRSRLLALTALLLSSGFTFTAGARADDDADTLSCAVEDTANVVFIVVTPADPSRAASATQTCGTLAAQTHFAAVSPDSQPDGLVLVCTRDVPGGTFDFYALPDGTSNQEAQGFCALTPN